MYLVNLDYSRDILGHTELYDLVILLVILQLVILLVILPLVISLTKLLHQRLGIKISPISTDLLIEDI